jgi:ABC-2 type transport system ATP-binding protein
MNVARGEVFGFLGANGAGKTTAVKVLLGLARPSSGYGRILGTAIGDVETRRQLGYLPELFRYQDWLSAREVLGLHCALAALPAARRVSEIGRVLDLVGLAARADDRVVTFSKGMQQRLGLAVAMLGAPALLFLDEPTSALDPVGRHDVREIILALKGRGTTVFLNSHLLTEVEQVCDRAAIINRGEVLSIGPIAELTGAPKAVRLRISGLSAEAEAQLRTHGAVHTDGSWYTLTGVDEERVPLVVAEIVSSGTRVYAVQPHHTSLEERFLQLLETPERAATDNRPANPA